jgi:hypothetical protein
MVLTIQWFIVREKMAKVAQNEECMHATLNTHVLHTTECRSQVWWVKGNKHGPAHILGGHSRHCKGLSGNDPQDVLVLATWCFIIGNAGCPWTHRRQIDKWERQTTQDRKTARMTRLNRQMGRPYTISMLERALKDTTSPWTRSAAQSSKRWRCTTCSFASRGKWSAITCLPRNSPKLPTDVMSDQLLTKL